MSSARPWGIHWFRRDLRLEGNEALRINVKRNEGRTLGLFCFDSNFLSRPDFSHHRFAFFLKTLSALRNDLRKEGGDLLIVDALPSDFFPKLIRFAEKNKIKTPPFVTWNRDYEPYARTRDAEVAEILERSGVDYHVERDHLILEPNEVTKSEKEGDFYQVFTPYSKNGLPI